MLPGIKLRRSRDPRPLLRYTAKNLRVPCLHPRCVSREEVDVIHADRHRERGISTQFPYLLTNRRRSIAKLTSRWARRRRVRLIL
jgi:hypothetical protein